MKDPNCPCICHYGDNNWPHQFGDCCESMNERKPTWEIIRNALLFTHPDIEIPIKVAYYILSNTDCPAKLDDALMTFEDEVYKLMGLPIRN